MSKDKNTFSAVTTFNLNKHHFGVEMINSFFANWPDEVKLTAYIENASPIDDQLVKNKIIIKEFHEDIPEYKQFCEKFKEKEFFEITSSGLNMAWKDNNEKDSKQIIDTINTNNFGLIKFSNRFFDVLFFDENGKKIHSSHFIIKR